MRAAWMLLLCLGGLAGCAAEPGAMPPPRLATLPPSPLPPPPAAAARAPAPSEVPDRDPSARGALAIDLSRADLPDDRDGDGVDQLDLCPELPPERVDGCPHTH